MKAPDPIGYREANIHLRLHLEGTEAAEGATPPSITSPPKCSGRKREGIAGVHKCSDRHCYEQIPPLELHQLAHPMSWNMHPKK